MRTRRRRRKRRRRKLTGERKRRAGWSGRNRSLLEGAKVKGAHASTGWPCRRHILMGGLEGQAYAWWEAQVATASECRAHFVIALTAYHVVAVATPEACAEAVEEVKKGVGGEGEEARDKAEEVRQAREEAAATKAAEVRGERGSVRWTWVRGRRSWCRALRSTRVVVYCISDTVHHVSEIQYTMYLSHMHVAQHRRLQLDMHLKVHTPHNVWFGGAGERARGGRRGDEREGEKEGGREGERESRVFSFHVTCDM